MALTWIGGMKAARPLTVATGKVSGTLTGFPAHVAASQLSDLWPYMAREDTGDLRFSLEDGTVLYHETVAGSKSGQSGEWHVRVPSCAVGTAIYAQVGSTSHLLPSEADQQATWSDHAGVWHYNEGTGSTAYDSTANANHATMTGAFGTGLQGYGVASGHAVSPHSDSLMPSQITVAIWFKATNMSGWPFLVAKNFDWNWRWGYYLLCGPAANYHYLQFGINTTFTDTNDVYLDDGQWHWGVGTYDKHQVCCYYDGDLVSAKPLTDEINYTFTAGLDHRAYYHGGNYGWGEWTGDTDEMRILPWAMTANEIKAAYNTQKSPGSFWTVGDVVLARRGSVPAFRLSRSRSLAAGIGG